MIEPYSQCRQVSAQLNGRLDEAVESTWANGLALRGGSLLSLVAGLSAVIGELAQAWSPNFDSHVKMSF